MEDNQIIDLYWQRDERAIGETDTKYGSFCHKLAMNILHSFQDSEECVSDAYGRCWDTMPPQRHGSLRAYLGAILRNLSISRYRAAHAQKRFGGVEVLLSELADCVPSPDNVQRSVEAEELGELRDFVECVIWGRRPQSDFALARETVKVVYGAYCSAEEGRRFDF